MDCGDLAWLVFRLCFFPFLGRRLFCGVDVGKVSAEFHLEPTKPTIAGRLACLGFEPCISGGFFSDWLSNPVDPTSLFVFLCSVTPKDPELVESSDVIDSFGGTFPASSTTLGLLYVGLAWSLSKAHRDPARPTISDFEFFFTPLAVDRL